MSFFVDCFARRTTFFMQLFFASLGAINFYICIPAVELSFILSISA